MKQRFKIQIVFTIEYDADAVYYEENSTPEQMLQTDISNARQEPLEFLTMFDYCEAKVTGEIL